MSKREIASLACKILGIYLIIQGTNVLSGVLSFSIATPNQMAHESLFNIIFSLVYILFGVLLWFLSDKLSLIMVKKGENHSNEGSGIEVSEIQRVSFSVLGLYFLGNSLPKLVSTLANVYFMSELTPRLILSGGAIIEFIIGLGIFLGSQALVNFLTSIRTAGLKRKDDNEEKE